MPRHRRFEWGLVLIAVLALVVRVLYARWADRYGVGVFGDARRFHEVAQGLADGRGFVEVTTPHGPTAEHPPGVEVYFAGLDLVGLKSYLAHRIALAVTGTATVVLIGLVGRRVGGSATGLTAAGLAALYPMLWTADGSLMSESLYGVFLVAALLAALRLRQAPSAGRAAVLGVVIGAAALTRGEGLALPVLLALPAAWAAESDGRARLRTGAIVLAATVCVVAPWSVYSSARFDRPVLISTNADGVFVGANCARAYDGPFIGTWSFSCYGPRRPGEDEATYLRRQRTIGIEYALDHADRWPAVAAARLGRLFDVYRYGQSIYLNAAEGRAPKPMRIAIRVYWGVLALAVAGAVLLWVRRRRGELAVLMAPVGMVILVALVTYGGTRFRFAAEPSFVLLAAVTLVAGAETARRRLSAGGPG